MAFRRELYVVTSRNLLLGSFSLNLSKSERVGCLAQFICLFTISIVDSFGKMTFQLLGLFFSSLRFRAYSRAAKLMKVALLCSIC